MTEIAFNVAAAQGHAAWPTYAQFLNAATRRRIERLYAPDFAAFGPYL